MISDSNLNATSLTYDTNGFNDAFLTVEETTTLKFEPHVYERLAQLSPEEKKQELIQYVSYTILVKDNLDLLEKMLERGFSLRNFSRHGMPYDNPPHNAISMSITTGYQKNQNKIFDFLLEQNLDINYVNKDLIGPPLLMAAYNNNLYCFEKLLNKGANTNYTTDAGESILTFILKNTGASSTNTVWIDTFFKHTELSFEDLNAPYSQRETVFEHLFNHYDTTMFDKILQNIQTPDTLLKLSPRIALYMYRLSHKQNLAPEEVLEKSKAPQKLEKRIFEIEKNKLSKELANYETNFRITNGKGLDDNNQDRHKTFKI